MTTRPNTTATHPTPATLQELFDGNTVDPAAARHARDCPSCAHQLQALTDQRTALGHLLHREANWVTAVQRQGRAVLADLLAELARACIARQQAAPRGAPLSELPRPAERITADLRTLVTRLSRLASLPEAASVARVTDWAEIGRIGEGAETDPSRLERCVAALRGLEGNSSRVRALMSG